MRLREHIKCGNRVKRDVGKDSFVVRKDTHTYSSKDHRNEAKDTTT